VNVDDALTAYRGELVGAAERWHKNRAHRRRRLVLLTSALAAAGIVVGAAIAAHGWLVGSPAPPNVKADFGSYAPQLGFNPHPGRAVLVARDGAYKLYATTNKQGGYCTLIVTPQYHPGPHGEGGDCAGPDHHFLRANAVPTGSLSTGKLLLIGHTNARGAGAIGFTTPDGSTETARLGSSGFFLVHTDVPTSIICRAAIQPAVWWKPTLTVLDRSGHRLGTATETFKGGCMPRPIPVHAFAVQRGHKQFRVRGGEFGILVGARARDRVFCHDGGDVIHLMVPPTTRHGVHRQQQFAPSKPPLQLYVNSARNGRPVVAECNY
jgi:hypothetical protein